MGCGSSEPWANWAETFTVQGWRQRVGRQAFGIGDNTARNHVNSIIEKLEVSDRAEAATIAMRQGLVSL